jgi:hypothetical protein
VEDAKNLESQGVCGGVLQGQSTRACSLGVGVSTVNPWTMLFPLFSGTGWIVGWKISRKGKK